MPPGVARVPVSPLVLELAAAQGDLVGVNHHHEVAGVDVRREDRLVLPAQQYRHLAGQAAKHDIGGVDDDATDAGCHRPWG